MKLRNILIGGLALIAVSSCKKNLPDVGGTAAQKMANEWWVQLYQNNVAQYPATYRGHIATYNTAGNGNELWIDDQAEIWDFKVKATADFNNLTFSANNVESVVPGYNIKVKITDGKVLPGAGISKTGNVTDSIYMKIEFEDDPGTVYEIRGHARTRFAEDDYH